MTGPRAAPVTGAAYGIGAPSALALAGDGCDVAVSRLNPDDLADTVQAIAKTGARAVPVTLDVRSLASIERAMADVLAAFGSPDVLVQQRRRAAHPHRRRRHRGGVILVDGGLTSY